MVKKEDESLPQKIHEAKPVPQNEGEVLGKAEQAFLEQITGGDWKKYGRVGMAALGGIPWIGSILGAIATLSSEKDSEKTNKLLYLWVREHEEKLKLLVQDLRAICARLDGFGDQITGRIQSPEYLNLMRKTFRVWDAADTAEKRDMLRKVITNAGGVSIVQDDIVRLFVELIDRLNELHFRIIRDIFFNPGISSYELALNLFGGIPQDNSAKADLFKALMHDLNMADLVRQPREADHTGQFVRKTPEKRPKDYEASRYLKTPFDPDKKQILTALGTEFVHYVMEELAPQLEAGK